MKINWKVRFKNKVWLASFFAAIVTFVYTMLGMFDIYPEITQNDIGEIINSVLMFLSLIGVIADPTTNGLGDSLRAMAYEVPWVDVKEDGTEEHSSDWIVPDEPDPEEGTVIVDTSKSESEG